jgi:hypothetical protein
MAESGEGDWAMGLRLEPFEAELEEARYICSSQKLYLMNRLD